MSLDDDIAITPVDDGRYTCEISRNYWLTAGPNGGYLAALLAHAGTTRLADPDRQLRSLTVHYPRRPDAGPANLRADLIHQGRSVAFGRVDLEQEGRVVATATGSWAKPREGVEYASWTPPEAPDPDTCPSMSSVREDGPFPIHRQWDIRSIEGVPFGQGERAEMRWWIRPPEHRPLDAPMLTAMSDALPPPIFAVSMPAAGVPTLDLTVHVRAQLDEVRWEPGDWVLCRFTSRLAADGFVEEDGELWSADGILLANSRQLAIAV